MQLKMMEDVDLRIKLNPGLPWQKQHSTWRRFFLFHGQMCL